MNDLAKGWIQIFPLEFLLWSCRSDISLAGWSAFPFPGGPRPREPGSPSAIAGSARATTSPSINCPAQAVLGCVANVLVRVEEASRLGHSEKRRELASDGVSFVLGMGLQSPTSRRTETCQQRGPRLNLPYGCRECDLGSTAHSR